MIPWLRPTDPPDAFPPVIDALDEPDGLLCAGGDLSPGRLVAGYRRGIFPWFSQGQPILWWSPDPRMVLFPHALKVSRSFGKSLRNRGFRVTVDTCFADVAARCADTGGRAGEGTWISPEMHAAYVELHRQGYAHSVETWLGDELVGGLYGILLDRIFFGESMFSTGRDASKVALYWLVQTLLARQVRLIDCQVASEHLFTLGAHLMPRAEFVAHLDDGIEIVRPGASWVSPED